MQTMPTPRTINQARTLANIQARAESITDDYRLLYNRHEQKFFVAHKEDRSRRYVVTARSCSCPSQSYYRCCKHFLGLAELAQVEITRYTLLGWTDEADRFRTFLAEVNAARRR